MWFWARCWFLKSVVEYADDSVYRFPMSELKITVDVFAEARRAAFLALDGLPPRERSKVATAIVERLRKAGLLARGVEYHYSAMDLAALLGRCDEYVIKRCMNGELSPVMKDGRGWLIPASTAQRWLDEHTFGKSIGICTKDTGASGGKNNIKAAAFELITSTGDGNGLILER